MSTTLAWTCYDDAKKWLRKHKRAILITAAAGAGTYIVYRYYVSSQREKERESAAAATKLLEAEERAESQLQQHFASIQRISDSTTMPSILPHLRERLYQNVDLSTLTERLMAGKQDSHTLTAKEKLQIWEQLKVLSFTRTMVATWSTCLLGLFLRTQLNILGRHVYLDTARDSTSGAKMEGNHGLSKRCQHRFIGFADYLPYKGLESLTAAIHEAVEKVVASVPLKAPSTRGQLHEILWNVREDVEGRGLSWADFVLPQDNILPEDLAAASSAADATSPPGPHKAAADDDEKLEALLLETRAVLASTEFQEALSAATAAVLKEIEPELGRPFGDEPQTGIPLAKLLPHVASVGGSLLDTTEDNRFVTVIAELPEVQALCAMVYSNTSPMSESG